MARDAIAEWRRALMGRGRTYRMFVKRAEPSPGLRAPSPTGGEGRIRDQSNAVGGMVIQPFDLSKTRPLAPAAPQTNPSPGLRPPSPSGGEGRSDGIVLEPFDLSKTRPLAPAARIASDPRDLSTAIRVLQRHNRLLLARFGIGWADATNFVLGESHRRGTTATLLARGLSLRLREAAT